MYSRDRAAANPLVPPEPLEKQEDRGSKRLAVDTVHICIVLNVSTYLPASDAEEEANDIGLLLALQLGNVLEGTHGDCGEKRRG